MDRLNLPEDMPIESKMVSKAIERAQSQVEGQNYELRKNVLKYDEVMNKQREVVYEQRRQLLEGADLSEKALEFVAEAVESAISTYANLDAHPEEWDWEGLDAAMAQLYPTQLTGTFDKEGTSYPALLDAYQEEALTYYAKREEEIGKEKMRELERLVFISILDNKWREHLYEMDYLREGIGLRGYGQRDPEMEYKREGYDMFQAMMAATKDEFARYMFHVQVVEEVQDQPAPTTATHDVAPTMVDAPVDAPTAAPNGAPKPQPAPAPAKVSASVGGGPAPDSGEYEKVGRNAPCPCGSGRKYKKCHGAEV
jgi:preprotein translocase subunit SecA